MPVCLLYVFIYLFISALECITMHTHTHQLRVLYLKQFIGMHVQILVLMKVAYNVFKQCANRHTWRCICTLAVNLFKTFVFLIHCNSMWFSYWIFVVSFYFILFYFSLSPHNMFSFIHYRFLCTSLWLFVHIYKLFIYEHQQLWFHLFVIDRYMFFEHRTCSQRVPCRRILPLKIV